MDRLVDDAVRATVDEAISSGDILHIPDASRRIAAGNPSSGLRASEIAELLMRAGVSAGVPLEWDALRD